MRDATGQARKLYSEDPVGYTVFFIQGEWGLEKPTLSFLGVVAPPGYLVRCVFKSAEGLPQTPALGLNLNAGLIPSPTQ